MEEGLNAACHRDMSAPTLNQPTDFPLGSPRLPAGRRDHPSEMQSLQQRSAGGA
jgi:hypothetical protein